MTGRKNIKLPESLFLALRDDKPDYMSWPTYFETECLKPEPSDAQIEIDMDEVLGRIDDLENELPRKVAEQLR